VVDPQPKSPGQDLIERCRTEVDPLDSRHVPVGDVRPLEGHRFVVYETHPLEEKDRHRLGLAKTLS